MNVICELLEDISTLINRNQNEDGTYCFDENRAIVLLDFAKTEIDKMALHKLDAQD